MTGMQLAKRYKMDLRDAHYQRRGLWYWPLERFPGAYFNARGYLLFRTEYEFVTCSHLGIGKNVYVKGARGTSISSINRISEVRTTTKFDVGRGPSGIARRPSGQGPHGAPPPVACRRGSRDTLLGPFSSP